MARFLTPKDTGMFRLNFDALDGNVNSLSFADPIPLPMHMPIRTLVPWGGYGGLRRPVS